MTKMNQQNAQINSGLIYYWSITPTCFGPSVEAIIREFEIQLLRVRNNYSEYTYVTVE